MMVVSDGDHNTRDGGKEVTKKNTRDGWKEVTKKNTRDGWKEVTEKNTRDGWKEVTKKVALLGSVHIVIALSFIAMKLPLVAAGHQISNGHWIYTVLFLMSGGFAMTSSCVGDSRIGCHMMTTLVLSSVSTLGAVPLSVDAIQDIIRWHKASSLQPETMGMRLITLVLTMMCIAHLVVSVWLSVLCAMPLRRSWCFRMICGGDFEDQAKLDGICIIHTAGKDPFDPLMAHQATKLEEKCLPPPYDEVA